MQRHSREYWKEQLREYWGSGFTVSEYSELIGQPHMTVMRWIRKLRSEHESSEIIEPERKMRKPAPGTAESSFALATWRSA